MSALIIYSQFIPVHKHECIKKYVDRKLTYSAFYTTEHFIMSIFLINSFEIVRVFPSIHGDINLEGEDLSAFAMSKEVLFLAVKARLSR